jgi:putative transposase
MARPLRIEYEGAIYHVTSRGNARNEIFLEETDRADFLSVLRAVIRRFRWICHAYCLMDNHYHLLIETPEANLSAGMRQLNGVFTQYFNRKHGRIGHLLQGRFKAILVEKESYLLELCRYVVLNPVRARLVPRPEKWKWSSYSATAGLERSPDFLTVTWLLSQFSSKRKEAQQQYREFVLDGMQKESPWQSLTGQIFLGSIGFLEPFRDLLEERQEMEEIPRPQRFASRPPLGDLFREAGRNRLSRDKMIYESHVQHGYTLKEIAQHLGIHYTTVSRAVKRAEGEMQ